MESGGQVEEEEKEEEAEEEEEGEETVGAPYLAGRWWRSVLRPTGIKLNHLYAKTTKRKILPLPSAC